MRWASRSPSCWANPSAGFVAQRYIARHPGHPAKVILSSTSPHMALQRKLAMFEELGGPQTRAVAEAFWTQPNEATWAEYNRVCKRHYNRRPAPNDDAHHRIIFNEPILFASAGGEQQTMNLLPGLANAQCPVLVMAGMQDPVCPLDDSRDIAAALPPQWMRISAFANSGHGAWRDEPEAAFALLRDFILSPGV
jgi:pimeloyl-ACP methyl ester carboxylesterase